MRREGAVRLKTSEIVVPEWHGRSILDSNDLECLRNSIEKYGQLEPILVRPRRNGDYELIAGYMRLTACRELGMDMIDARIIDCSDAEAVFLALSENIERSQESPFDTARKLQYLQSTFGLNDKEIAERLGRSKSWVSRMLSILNISDEARRILGSHVRDYRKLSEIARIMDPDLQARVASIVVSEKLGLRQVESLVRDVLERGDEALSQLPRGNSCINNDDSASNMDMHGGTGAETSGGLSRELLAEFFKEVRRCRREEWNDWIAACIEFVRSLRDMGVETAKSMVRMIPKTLLKKQPMPTSAGSLDTYAPVDRIGEEEAGDS
ncbi:MAG: ParB/RepB/Spo0J family partition protein [Nitrososphaerota archaeon]